MSSPRATRPAPNVETKKNISVVYMPEQLAWSQEVEDVATSRSKNNNTMEIRDEIQVRGTGGKSQSSGSGYIFNTKLLQILLLDLPRRF